MTAASFPLPDLPALTGAAAAEADQFLDLAAEQARGATCLRSSCGAVVVLDGRVLGVGNNSLPGGCAPSACLKETGALGAGFKSDRTCCTHAEVRAIANALKSGCDVRGATVYFTRVAAGTGERVVSGRPYCTICSKFALEVGLAFFVLAHDFGIVAYPAGAYNDLSFTYGRTDG